jgi:hypothetical protein
MCGNKFIIRAHFSTYIYLYLIYACKVRNNASLIIVNLITVDSIIFVGISFRSKLKKKIGKLWILNFMVCGILPDHLL